jgi:hypothetical protein
VPDIISGSGLLPAVFEIFEELLLDKTIALLLCTCKRLVFSYL